MLCLPLRKLSGWLSTISPNKVKPELREKVIAYQNECDDALWDYWNNGIAVRTPYVANSDDVAATCRSRKLGQQLAILEENEMLRKLLAKCGALAEH